MSNSLCTMLLILSMDIEVPIGGCKYKSCSVFLHRLGHLELSSGLGGKFIIGTSPSSSKVIMGLLLGLGGAIGGLVGGSLVSSNIKSLLV